MKANTVITEEEICHQLSFGSLKLIIKNPPLSDDLKKAAAYELGWRIATSQNGKGYYEWEDQK